jgi:hypothetical protein
VKSGPSSTRGRVRLLLISPLPLDVKSGVLNEEESFYYFVPHLTERVGLAVTLLTCVRSCSVRMSSGTPIVTAIFSCIFGHVSE